MECCLLIRMKVVLIRGGSQHLWGKSQTQPSYNENGNVLFFSTLAGIYLPTFWLQVDALAILKTYHFHSIYRFN